jgi:hypothetical protein
LEKENEKASRNSEIKEGKEIKEIKGENTKKRDAEVSLSKMERELRSKPKETEQEKR